MSPPCRPFKSLPIIGSPARKFSLPADNIGKNPSRPGGRRAERIFAGKLSAGRDFSGAIL